MMLKIILYAYVSRIYSSRQIAKQLGENIYFIWLSGNQKPDFRTINRFRSNRMKDVIFPFQFSCAKGKDAKSISVSMKNQKQRQEVREKLSSEDDEKKYKQRKMEVEPVFGQIKYNSYFQRF